MLSHAGGRRFSGLEWGKVQTWEFNGGEGERFGHGKLGQANLAGKPNFVRTGEKLKLTRYFAPEGPDSATVVGPNLGHGGRQNIVGFSMGVDIGRTWGDLDEKFKTIRENLNSTSSRQAQ